MAVRRKCSGTLSVQNQEWSQLIPGTERRKSAKIGQVSASCSCFIKKKVNCQRGMTRKTYAKI